VFSREISLYKKLSEKNVKILFLTYGNSKDLQFSKLLGSINAIPCLDLIKAKNPKMKFLKSFFLPFKLKNLFRETDIIKTNQLNGSWVAWIAKLLYRKKLIARGGYDWLIAHIKFSNKKGFKNYFVYLLRYFLIFIIELVTYRLADGIILTTTQELDFITKYFKLKRKYRKNKIRQFFNFVDVDLFKPLNLSKKEKHILFIGRLSNEKNLENLLTAIKDLDGFILDIIGTGQEEEKLKTMAKAIRANVNFLGLFPNNEIPKILNQYPILILPSFSEGNPKVLLEAMSCGVACIGTNVIGINNIISHKVNGYLCNTSSGSIRDAILSLYNDKILREKIGNNGRAYVIDKCSLKSIFEKEYLFYKQIFLL